ncbi:Rab family, other [Angomonas deanei]|nr:Rab family, other [Angomonas deanei]|eukprot:EPY26093.1 Rab family, other [Angomonas deanei]
MDRSTPRIKILVLGDSDVGKANLITRYVKDEFWEGKRSAFDFLVKTTHMDGKEVRIELWDTPSRHAFHPLHPSMFRDVGGAMIVYDITNQSSFDSVATWLQELRVFVPPTCCIFLIGNKCDLEHLRVVRKENADKFARENGLSFLETSALEKTNVDKAFEWLAKSVFDVSVAPSTEAPSNRPGGPVKADIAKPREEKKEKSCC